ncbi:transposase family protein [Neobacillus pocheonensis]|uniref:Transposase family protein n=1 Tax=Neobacillus pocheonensis TaxID=363869 RepID=A0ABT0WEY2_9BACI|nr:transposase family protein [Neobacillus pocheonensis]
MDEEQCPHCGFHTRIVHDSRTRKIRDLSVLNKPLILLTFRSLHNFLYYA